MKLNKVRRTEKNLTLKLRIVNFMIKNGLYPKTLFSPASSENSSHSDKKSVEINASKSIDLHDAMQFFFQKYRFRVHSHRKI